MSREKSHVFVSIDVGGQQGISPIVLLGRGSDQTRVQVKLDVHSAPQVMKGREVMLIMNEKETADFALALLRRLPFSYLASNRLEELERLVEIIKR